MMKTNLKVVLVMLVNTMPKINAESAHPKQESYGPPGIGDRRSYHPIPIIHLAHHIRFLDLYALAMEHWFSCYPANYNINESGHQRYMSSCSIHTIISVSLLRHSS